MNEQENCCLCLNVLKSRYTELFTKTEDGLTCFDKISLSLSRLANVLNENSLINCKLCDKCCNTIDMVYQFNNTCLQNAQTYFFDKNIAKVKTEQEQCDVSPESSQTYYWKMNEEVFIKSEMNNEDFIDSSNISTENFVKEENISSMSDSPVCFPDDILPIYKNQSKNFNTQESDNLLQNSPKIDDPDDSLPSDIEDVTTETLPTVLSSKSKERYEQTFKDFENWCIKRNLNDITEMVLLSYFEYLITKNFKSSSLWAKYSMLRATINTKKNIDISKFSQLIAFLKRQAEGYKPKKSKILTNEDIIKFLNEADDEKFLLIKVVLIVALAGACTKQELCYMRYVDLKEYGNSFHVKIPYTKTKKGREFFITKGNIAHLDLLEFIKKYLKLRPNHVDHGRLFVSYRNGKCIKLPVGINTIGNFPKLIAKFLKLPNPEEYTGHCFKRSSTSLLTDTGTALLSLKRKGSSVGESSSTIS